MAKGALRIEVKDEVTARLRQLEAQTKTKVTREGLLLAGQALWDDAVNIDPQPPVLTGTLRGSGNLIVQNKNVPAPPQIQEGGKGDAGTVTTGDNAAVFGFNTPYAVWQHERPGSRYKSHTVPEENETSGPGFVRKKIMRFAQEYGRMMAEGVRKGLNNI